MEPSARVHIDRAWLQASDELVIRESTSAESIAAFVIKVRPTDDGKLAGAIEAIVAQVRAELGAVRKARPDEEPYALLVCREYYMKWRGRESATSRPKGRYGLFLVRGCVRCKSDKKVAVFRVHAYAFKNGARSASRYVYHAKKGGTGHKCQKEHNEAEPWKCDCCKHLYCAVHGHEAAPVLKASCGTCKDNRWRRRSKTGAYTTKRKEEASHYEPIRRDMYFTELNGDALATEISGPLIAAYHRKSPAAITAPISQQARAGAEERATGARRSSPRGQATDSGQATIRQQARAEPEESAQRASPRGQAAPEGGTDSAFAPADVPKITLKGLVHLRRSRRHRFGRYV